MKIFVFCGLIFGCYMFASVVAWLILTALAVAVTFASVGLFWLTATIATGIGGVLYVLAKEIFR